jgi:hypothetical protein
MQLVERLPGSGFNPVSKVFWSPEVWGFTHDFAFHSDGSARAGGEKGE